MVSSASLRTWNLKCEFVHVCVGGGLKEEGEGKHEIVLERSEVALNINDLKEVIHLGGMGFCQ